MVENRRLDYELLQRWIAYMAKSTDKYHPKDLAGLDQGATSRRAAADAITAVARTGDARKPLPRHYDNAPPPSRLKNPKPDDVPKSAETRKPRIRPAAPTTTAAAKPAATNGGRRRRDGSFGGGGGEPLRRAWGGGGGVSPVKKLADEFQAEVVRVMLARKDLDDETSDHRKSRRHQEKKRQQTERVHYQRRLLPQLRPAP